VFHIVKEKHPFSLSYRSLPSKKLRKGLVEDIRDLLAKYRKHQDKIDLTEKWNGTLTREGKLMEALDLILQRNYRGRER
jgi:hypothetical protein